MNKKQAKSLIRDTFNYSFSEDKFKNFVANMLNEMEFFNQASLQGKYIKKAFRDQIKQYKRIGKYYDSNNRRIDILTVRLRKSTSLDIARTMQRNFIAQYLNGGRGDILRDAAIVAFYHDDLDYWRFSFVKMEYSWKKDENGKVKVEEELTPARRYSFLVGKSEPSHTASEQLFPLIKNDKNNPTLNEIEQAFSIERITEEFFKKYRERFLDLKEEIDGIVSNYKEVKREFNNKNINSTNFAKKILGQIVFLYFIQKKGWLGVEKGEDWGTGPHDFLQKLFRKEIIDYDNFFNDILEPLFYEALATDRGKLNYYNLFDCRIPFLNGGLFEPLKRYNWAGVDILIDNKLFESIFNTFDRYNFTVREDEPLEKEVAVDPEMLGKVFERLLDVKDRKSKGAYYTPREVVHYMCQQSLVNYINTELEDEIEKDKIKELVQVGDLAVENDRAKIEKNIKSYDFKLDKDIIEKAELIDEKLKGIKICDPAIGSGAFPVGIMHEIVRTRKTLTPYLQKQDNNRSIYNLKRHAIQESIYGVDIDSGAVEIAKLRLWLSLVVEEEDIKRIKPLPNLDFKIMQGNSLIEEFKGIRLNGFNEKNKLFYSTINYIENLIQQLENALDKYFNASARRDKDKYREKVDKLIINIFKSEIKHKYQEYFNESNKIDDQAVQFPKIKDRENFIKEQKEQLNKKHNFNFDKAKEELKDYTDSYKEKPFFLWKIYFANVFMENNGFDIVIANPPYVNTKEVNKKLKSKYKEIYGLRDDLYNYFFLKSFEILKNKGILCFISSDTYLTINSKINLRKLFQKNRIIELIKTENVFDNVKVEPAIITVQKENTVKNNYNMIFKDAIENFEEPESYNIDINKYRNVVNQVFYKPTKFNLSIFKKYGSKIKQLHDKWWDKIRTSRKVKKYKEEIQKYRNKLKPGDVTLLGLVVEGGVGLQTADNGRFIGVINNSKIAKRIKETRPKKLYTAIQEYNINSLNHINSKTDAKNYLDNMSEKSIRKLFDKLKQEYDRDIFGQGYLYKIISNEEIANVDNLTDNEKKNGISKDKPHFVLYDKGDREGNRWYLESPYYIDWNKEKVRFLYKYSGKSGRGMPVVRNPRFYFKKGFCWTDVNTTYLKCRLKDKGIYDVLSMSLFSQLDNVPDWYFVCLINSEFISEYVDDFVNRTSHFQMNDARQVPIIIPTKRQLEDFEAIFKEAYSIKKDQFAGSISQENAEIKLNDVQEELDRKVYKLYGLEIS